MEIKLTKKEKEKIIEAYNYGDIQWLDTIFYIIETKKENEDVLKLLTILYKMNYIVNETETESYASKYESKIKEIYFEMKGDLAKMLNFKEMWKD